MSSKNVSKTAEKTASKTLLKVSPASVRSFQSFGFSLDRMLYWTKQDELGSDVLVIVFDNKEKLILRDAAQIQEAEAFFGQSSFW